MRQDHFLIFQCSSLDQSCRAVLAHTPATAGIWSELKVDNSLPSIVFRLRKRGCSDLRSQELFSQPFLEWGVHRVIISLTRFTKINWIHRVHTSSYVSLAPSQQNFQVVAKLNIHRGHSVSCYSACCHCLIKVTLAGTICKLGLLRQRQRSLCSYWKQ